MFLLKIKHIVGAQMFFEKNVFLVVLILYFIFNNTFRLLKCKKDRLCSKFLPTEN